MMVMNPQLNGVRFLFVPTVLIIFYCFMAPTSIAVVDVHDINTDQSSLLAFKHHITNYDPNNFLAKNWSLGTSVCNWIGITCGSSHLRVTALNLSYMGLVGTIPPQLGNLSFITMLDLRNNSFHGSLPSKLAQLRRLKLISLTSNNFSGEIPSWFALLPKITILLLGNNSFMGHIAPSLFNITSLLSLDLGDNKLSGLLPYNFFQAPALEFVSVNSNQISGPIPSTVSNITSMQTIDLSNNHLSGEVPKNIFYYLHKLQHLNLGENQFSGEIPLSLFGCKHLQYASLAYNSFKGNIPREIGNLTGLEQLNLADNKFQGTIPYEIGNLHHLQFLVIQYNNLTGKIPTEIFNISTIQIISLALNKLSGSLPTTLGFTAPNLEELYLGGNHLSGKIPSSLSNASMLTLLDISQNSFSGYIPNIFNNLRKLELLNLELNKLTSDLELSIINSLASSKNIKIVSLEENPLNSILPVSIGNLSSSLEKLLLGENQLTGIIPVGIGNLKELQGLFLYRNMLEGHLPSVICQLKNLWKLELDTNTFSGPIPSCMGNITILSELSLNNNKFNMTIPSELLDLPNLFQLDLSSNELTGFLSPDIANLKVLVDINLSDNALSGNIPSNIESLQGLVNLSLSRNQLQGPIPESLGKLLSLELLDLSQNQLYGIIPKSLEALVHLHSFNVSYNKLEGEIPSGGAFNNLSSLSFIGNEGLCSVTGLQVPSCKTTASSKSQEIIAMALKIVLPMGVATTIIVIFVYQLKRKNHNNPSNVDQEDTTMTTWRRISYQELQQATNQFSEINLLGTGSFGKVYKGILTDGINVAIKVFNLEFEGGFRSFDSECEVLRNARHRNLVKIISSCSNDIDFKALILSYMPNGSLESWLYSNNCCLNIVQKMNIMIDVAAALDYLHHRCSIPIVHCDLKPSNVLLDQHMVAHVTDFGIAKLLGGDSLTHTITLATLGYMAPEFGLEGIVSRQVDVYSYGILLMETFTRKKPTDEMFHGEFSIKQWVKELYPHAIIDVIADQLLVEGQVQVAVKKECLLSIMRLALDCSADSPNERENMRDILAALKEIRIKFLNQPRNPKASV